jgi:hypothetical protein
MRKLDRQNHRLLERLLRPLQPRNILPLHVRLIRQNRPRQLAPQFLLITILLLGTPIRLARAPTTRLPIRAHRRRLPLHVRVISLYMRLQFLRPLHVFPGLGADHLLGLGVLLPFQRQHEELQRGVVLLVGRFVGAGVVELDGFFYGVDGAAEEVGV